MILQKKVLQFSVQNFTKSNSYLPLGSSNCKWRQLLRFLFPNISCRVMYFDLFGKIKTKFTKPFNSFIMQYVLVHIHVFSNTNLCESKYYGYTIQVVFRQENWRVAQPLTNFRPCLMDVYIIDQYYTSLQSASNASAH